MNLIELLDDCFTVQKWHADNGTAVGYLDNLKNVFESLQKHGSVFDYRLTNATILQKEQFFHKAGIFVHDEVEIDDGCRVLGSGIDSDNAEKKFVERSLKQQKLSLRKLAARANVSPQDFYKSFISSIQHKLTFLARTTPNIEDLLRECEKSINNELLPNLLKSPAYNQKTDA